MTLPIADHKLLLVPIGRVGHVLARQGGGQGVRRGAGRRVGRARVELRRQLSDAVRQHVLLHVALGAEALVA